MAVDLGTGTTITFGTSGFAANLLSIDGPGISRESIDTSHMGTSNAHTFTPGDLYDGGSIDITFEFAGDDDPPYDGAEELITIDWGGAGTGKKWTFNAFMTDYSPGAAIDERMEASATLKVTGAVTTGVT